MNAVSVYSRNLTYSTNESEILSREAEESTDKQRTTSNENLCNLCLSVYMDAQGEQASPPELPLSAPTTGCTYPKIKLRSLRGAKVKLTQIHEKSPEPEQNNQLVLYDQSADSKSSKRKRGAANDFYDNPETVSSLMERAEELRANLDPSFPSFAKALVRSNVTVGFWMHLPMRFCKLYLPKNDTTVFLETESNEEFITNFIAERTAISGGWKAFCAGNNLREGDVLVFHLLKPLRFKVYVVRGDDSANVDAEFGTQYVDTETRQITSEEEDIEGQKKGKLLEILLAGTLQEANQERSLIVFDANREHIITGQSGSDEDCSFENLEVTRSSGLSVDMRDMQSIESFGIHVNGFAIDSELTEHHRNKYYELCCSQNRLLHEDILKSINYKLAAEIIIETVNITEAIRSSKLSSCRVDHAVWDKTLKGFELLGMKVGFVRARLSRLMSLAAESEAAMEEEYREARMEQTRVEAEMGSTEMKLLKLKESREKLDTEIEVLKENAEKHVRVFQEVVNAPW